MSIDCWRIAQKPQPDAPKMLILGAHHGREWISAEVPYLIGQRLVDSAADAGIAALLREIEIWVVPVVNPDGKEWSHRPDGFRAWRKNCRDLGGNIFGVDPNRNYDFGFGQGGFSSTDPRQEIYCGPYAFSEPESSAVRDLAQAQRFQWAVSYHSFGQFIRHPAVLPGLPGDAPCRQRLEDIARIANEMAASTSSSRGIKYSVVSSADMTAISGDCAEWLFHQCGTAAITVELPPERYDDPFQLFRLDSSEIQPIFEENWLGAMVLFAATAGQT